MFEKDNIVMPREANQLNVKMKMLNGRLLTVNKCNHPKAIPRNNGYAMEIVTIKSTKFAITC